MTIDELLQQVDASYSDRVEEWVRELGSRFILEDLDVDAIEAGLLMARKLYERERPHVLERSRLAMLAVMTPDGRLRENPDWDFNVRNNRGLQRDQPATPK